MERSENNDKDDTQIFDMNIKTGVTRPVARAENQRAVHNEQIVEEQPPKLAFMSINLETTRVDIYETRPHVVIDVRAGRLMIYQDWGRMNV